MSVTARVVLLVAIVGLIVVGATWIAGGESSEPEPAESATRRWHSSSQCRECHGGVWSEWFGSHHQIAYLNPEVRALSDDFRNKECQACHLPRPIATTGYGDRTLPRSTRPDEGVDCLTCHLGVDGGILGTRDVPSAPCAPRRDDAAMSVEACASCHNQHQTTDQWRASPQAAAGTTCHDCHMPAVDREGRTGRGHRFLGAHDFATLKSAGELGVERDAGELALSLENVGAGHNFPTEERHRAVDIVYRFDDAGDWRRAYRFRTPYRDESGPDTQLPAGEKVTARVSIPPDAKSVVVRLWYRLTPYIGDDDPRSTLLFEQSLDLTDPDAKPVRREVRPPVVEPVAVPAAGPTALTAQAAIPPAGRLPAPELRSLAAELDAAVAAGEPPPTDRRMAALRELMLTAYLPDYADARFAERARQSLSGEDGAAWALEEGLGHEHPTVRKFAAFQLGELDRRESEPLLIYRLKYEPDSAVRIWLASTLARFGNHCGLLDLIPAMRKPETYDEAWRAAHDVVVAAGATAAATPEELEVQLRELHAEWVRTGRARGATPQAFRPLTEARVAARMLALQQFQLRAVDDARFVLVRLGARVVPWLRRAVHASEKFLRNHALEVLTELGGAASAAAADVLPLLGDDLSASGAAIALGAIGATAALPHLLARLTWDDIELATAAARGLALLADPRSRPALVAVLEDESAPMDVRVQAAYGVARLSRGLQFLRDRKLRGDYHEPTIDELLNELRRGLVR